MLETHMNEGISDSEIKRAEAELKSVLFAMGFSNENIEFLKNKGFNLSFNETGTVIEVRRKSNNELVTELSTQSTVKEFEDKGQAVKIVLSDGYLVANKLLEY